VSIKRFSTGSISSPTPKNSKLWDQETFPGTFESIASAVVDASGATTITFSSIPSTYAHLQLRIMLPSSNEPALRFNSDSSTSYSRHGVYTAASAVAAYGSADQTYDGISYISTLASVMITDILDYANTNKYKTTRTLSGNEDTNATVAVRSALWRNTSAINTITLTQINSSNFPQYSFFALYGIRGA
jgi:hypothetical protein